MATPVNQPKAPESTAPASPAPGAPATQQAPPPSAAVHAAASATAPKAAGSVDTPIYVMATADGTFQYPGAIRAFFYPQGSVFTIPGLSFLRRWMKVVPGPNAQPPPRPPETTAANQPGFANNVTPPAGPPNPWA